MKVLISNWFGEWQFYGRDRRDVNKMYVKMLVVLLTDISSLTSIIKQIFIKSGPFSINFMTIIIDFLNLKNSMTFIIEWKKYHILWYTISNKKKNHRQKIQINCFSKQSFIFIYTYLRELCCNWFHSILKDDQIWTSLYERKTKFNHCLFRHVYTLYLDHQLKSSVNVEQTWLEN